MRFSPETQILNVAIWKHYVYRLLIFSFSASIHCFMQFYVLMSEVSINMKWYSGVKEHESQGKLGVTSSGRVVVAPELCSFGSFSEDVHIETRSLYYWPCGRDVTSDGVEPQCHRLLSRHRRSSRLLADNNRFLFSRSLPFHLPFSSSERWSDPTVWWNRRVLLSLGDWPRGLSVDPVIAFLPVFWPGCGEMDSILMREPRRCKPDSTTGWKNTFIKPPQDAWKLSLNCTDDDRTCYRSGNLHRSILA